MRVLFLTFMLSIGSFSNAAQPTTDDPWPISERCATINDTPAEQFIGTIFAYEPEVGVRGLRADLTTSYFVAFEGANFTGAAAISPSGEFIAIPSGLISFSTLVDETYQVNEIRVQSTDPATNSIANRIPWDANYRGTNQDLIMRDLRWLDENSLLYAEDDWQTERAYTTVFTIDAMTDAAEYIDDPVIQQITDGLSPDRTRAVGLFDFEIGLFDVATGDLLRGYTSERPQLAAWSPDSSQFVMQNSERIDGETIPYLTLIDRDGITTERIGDFEAAQLRWSADGTRFAFTTYDAEIRSHRLFIGDITERTIPDMCTSVRYGNQTTGYGLMWSPDGTLLAVLLPDAAQPLHLLDLESATLSPVTIYTETRYGFLIAWTP